MAIKLFKHNQKAYAAVKALLCKTNKAAVVHPTGTGKSFIAFKLCEDNLDKKVCWLSPSEYIFNTQAENLEETGAEVPENISFYTYAKLMCMEKSEIASIKPDIIILDEFHRCGAEVWGRGVAELLSCYPNACLLGLSATHIRYLDNQRNMADELFDGNIASEISLGDAIVRGILNPPKYVLSVFSYQKDLEKYACRVRHAKNKAVRDAASEYLEALRRALEKADALDEIFDKHMTDRDGKYIVFCSNVEHLHQMMKAAQGWFCKVDKNPHYYCAYSENPETDEDFSKFKEDESEHLKLLFCVDMLNEGIHVKDISGVILLRPTVSPIIYKQQIGRALSAGGKKDAVIFDIVLNIENLYSIGAIQKEMQIATTYYKEHGMTEEIVNSRFLITDEVKDCIDLFNGLNETLSASWEMMYLSAKQYYDKFQSLDVPVRYMTEEGFSLGLWVRTQRMVREGKCTGILTAEQIKKLDDIGMRWNSSRDAAWEKNYSIAKSYFERFGRLPITVSDRCFEGIKLERWLSKLRSYKKSGIQSDYLTAERIEALDKIGMVWDIPDFIWEQNYHAAVEFYKQHGNLKVPRDYVSPDGIKLGLYLATTRRTMQNGNRDKVITEEQILKLKELGVDFHKRKTVSWKEAYEYASQYKRKYGNLDVPVFYVTDDGYSLGRWIRGQRDSERKNKLPSDKKEKLDSLGMVWELPKQWDERFLMVEKYYENHGNVNLPEDLTIDGIKIGRWLNEQVKRLNENKGRLTQEQIRKLASVGISPNSSQNDAKWEKQYENAKAYYRHNGNLRISRRYCTESGEPLGLWIQAQRNKYKNGKLKAGQIEQLEKIGMNWEPVMDDWSCNYKKVKAFYEENGSLNLPKELKSITGGLLSVWFDNQRTAYKENKLSSEQIKQLEDIGMDWRPLGEIAWEEHYLEAKDYFEEHGNLKMPNSYKCPNGFVLGAWVKRQRENEKALSDDKRKKLNEIKMRW